MENGGHNGDMPLGAYCPKFQAAVELIGKRWTASIVRALLTGTTRFSEVQELIPGLSDRLLSQRLRELEAAGLVERTVIPATPVRVEYRLTSMGEDLRPAIEEISDWASRWAETHRPLQVEIRG